MKYRDIKKRLLRLEHESPAAEKARQHHMKKLLREYEYADGFSFARFDTDPELVKEIWGDEE